MYKYIHLNDAVDIDDENELKFKSLANKKIWFSCVDMLNDPFECSAFYFDYSEFRDSVKRLNFSDHEIRYWGGMIHFTFDSIKEALLLASFSGVGIDNMPLWAHYANNHRGFCIEYEILSKENLVPVLYAHERLDVTRRAAVAFSPVVQEMSSKADFDRAHADKEQYYYLLMNTLIKHTSWRYEKEYVFVN